MIVTLKREKGELAVPYHKIMWWQTIPGTDNCMVQIEGEQRAMFVCHSVEEVHNMYNEASTEAAVIGR